jgi:formate-dependent nitrite reductase membrane component NrfD
VWHWPIAVDLFLGGLSAGILFFAAIYTIVGKDKEFPTAVRKATVVVPFALMLALVALVIDLKNPLYSWRLYTTINLESPMSWGAWTLLAIVPLSMIWVFSYIRTFLPNWDWKFGMLNNFESWIIRNRKPVSWIMLFLAISLGIYTGILLSAFNARPLWNTSLLGPLFLTYGLLTGAATIMWMSRNKVEKKIFVKIDLVLIAIVLFLIIHLFMGFLAGPEVQLESAKLFLGGSYTYSFWGLVVFLGLILPGMLEILRLRGAKIPAGIPALCILIGGFMFRMIMVDAGQITRYLY